MLTVSKITDENEMLSYQFKDKLGRVVLEKKQLISPLTGVDVNDYASTYSIYDDFGRLYVMLPPEAVKKMKTSNNWNYLNSIYSGMIFKHTYDDRGRLASKTVPSGGTSTYAYDRLDRAVMVTDPNGVKMITRYDILSRPIISGKYIGTSAPAGGNPLYEIASTAATTHYYTATTFPTDNNNVQVYKAFYYDDYDLNNDGTVATTEQYTNPVEAGYATSAFGRTRGLATATQVGVLKVDNTAPTTFLINRIYYDKELRVIQTNAQNHLSGADIESSSYDFADRIVKKRRDHTATPPGGTAKAYTIREDYVYDHAGRTLFVAHQVGTQKREIIAAFTYDELGRVLTRKLHASNFSGTPLPTPGTSYSYLQTLDYTYNIRGWMTGINDPANCTMQAGNNNLDLFKLGLYYEAPPTGWTAQYNGNIAAAEWRVYNGSSCQTRHAYRFTYDANNRLSAAAHHTFVLGSWSLTNNYSESGISYDNNGNIKNYTRRGVTTGTSTFGVIDQLTYYFDDAVNPDRLTRVVDAGSATKGFVYAPPASGNHYLYDAAGNLTEDKHKKFTVAYNHLNLPRLLTFTDGSGRKIEFVYTADGAKLGQKALTNTTINSEKNYVNGIEYNGANTEAIYHSEGRLTPNGATAWYYEYSLRDHLGNARVNFRANGTAPQFLDEHHYYPFGMEMEGFAGGGTNMYRFNGIERMDFFNVNIESAFYRSYDVALGRWWQADPKPTVQQSVYTGMGNNPVLLSDFLGDTVVYANSNIQRFVENYTNKTYVNKKGKVKDNTDYDPAFAAIIDLLDKSTQKFTFTDDANKMNAKDAVAEINSEKDGSAINIVVPSWVGTGAPQEESSKLLGGRTFALFEEVFHASQYLNGELVKSKDGSGNYAINVKPGGSLALIEADAKIFAADRVGNLTMPWNMGGCDYDIETWAGLIRSTSENSNRRQVVANMLVNGETRQYLYTGTSGNCLPLTQHYPPPYSPY
ncbi:MAG: hypothetical protein J0L99_13175 [Chitinophagales bacterium]|nr:hypothetical protein [Chitinophagales bacterium]